MDEGTGGWKWSLGYCATPLKKGVLENFQWSLRKASWKIVKCSLWPFSSLKFPCQAMVDVSLKYIVQNFVVWFFISQFYLANEEKELWAFFTFEG